MKYLEKSVRQSGVTAGSLAYHDAHWTRRNAPLLDHMGAVIDHVLAHSRGGPADLSNLVTSCNKCNLAKSNLSAKGFREREPFHAVKNTYGEPENWDGFIRSVYHASREDSANCKRDGTRLAASANRRALSTADLTHYPSR
jgi:hypothetical protein